jgi:hypothetical protein
LERLHIALAEQGVSTPTPGVDVVVGGENAAAFREAARLRREGSRVIVAAGRMGERLEALAQSVGAGEAMEARGGEGGAA